MATANKNSAKPYPISKCFNILLQVVLNYAVMDFIKTLQKNKKQMLICFYSFVVT